MRQITPGCSISKEHDTKLPRMSSDLVSNFIDQDPDLNGLAATMRQMPSGSSTCMEAPSLSFDVHQLVMAEDFKSHSPKGKLDSLMSLLFQVGDKAFAAVFVPESDADQRSPS